jgi:hypothetical protein
VDYAVVVRSKLYTVLKDVMVEGVELINVATATVTIVDAETAMELSLVV